MFDHWWLDLMGGFISSVCSIFKQTHIAALCLRIASLLLVNQTFWFFVSDIEDSHVSSAMDHARRYHWASLYVIRTRMLASQPATPDVLSWLRDQNNILPGEFDQHSPVARWIHLNHDPSRRIHPELDLHITFLFTSEDLVIDPGCQVTS